MREPRHPDLADIALTDVFYALSDPTRLRIISELADGRERSGGQFGPALTSATWSYHFRILREAGLTRTRVRGRHRLISLRQQEFEARFPALLDAVLASGGVEVVRETAPSVRASGPAA